MEKHPAISFFGGTVLFVGTASVAILDALRRLDFLQKSHPTVYAGITSPPSMLAVGLTGLVAMLWGGWQLRQNRLARVAESEQSPPLQQPQEPTRQEIHNSPVGGNVRMAGRDYNETHVHNDPLLQARLEEFERIDDFLGKKSEIQLRETFDFPDMLKFNIKLARNFHWPGTVPAREIEEMNAFFAGGNAVLHKRLLDSHVAGDSLYMKGKPGKLYFTNTSRKYAEARAILMSLFSSSKLPASVVAALKDFDKTVEENIERLAASLNESFATNQRNIRENDDPASDRHGSAWNHYWGRFIHLRPRAESVSLAIRSSLESE